MYLVLFLPSSCVKGYFFFLEIFVFPSFFRKAHNPTQYTREEYSMEMTRCIRNRKKHGYLPCVLKLLFVFKKLAVFFSRFCFQSRKARKHSPLSRTHTSFWCYSKARMPHRERKCLKDLFALPPKSEASQVRKEGMIKSMRSNESIWIRKTSFVRVLFGTNDRCDTDRFVI